MRKRDEEFHSSTARIFNLQEKKIKEITFQVTENCNLCCSYCYQINKTEHKMNFETAKKLIDNIFANRLNPDSIWCQEKTAGLVFDFIGGEPFLEIDLIEQITDYIEDQLLPLIDCPWVFLHMYSFSSNGTLYFTEKVQNYIKKYRPFVSVGITVDGNKELHDSCRIFKNTKQGTYDLAIAAALQELHSTGGSNTKLTFSPQNVQYIADGIINLLSLGFDTIYGNPVFESGWEIEHAQIYFEQLKKVAHFIVDNELENKVWVRPLDSRSCQPYTSQYLKRNYCGISDSCNMLALDYKGDLYPCIRFMESSLAKDASPFILGNVDRGLLITEEEKERLILLSQLTAEKLCSDECLQCPIANGCAWCSAYNYQNGNLLERTTFHCYMHVAEALASKYLCFLTKDIETFNSIQIPQDKGKQVLTKQEDFFLL